MGRRTGGTKDVNALRNKIRIGIALAALAAIVQRHGARACVRSRG